MMSLMTLSASRRLNAVLGECLVLDAEPALEVEAELGLDRAPCPVGDVGSGIRRFGKKTMRRDRTPMRTMRMGPALRIPAGCYTKALPDAVGGGVIPSAPGRRRRGAILRIRRIRVRTS